jgi:hypothetical protein
MVNRKTRSERIKENRANRMKRAADIVEGKVSTVNTKNLKRNKMIILGILIFWAFCYTYSFKDSKVFSFNNRQFKEKYEVFVEKNKDKFEYDKEIDRLLKSKTEYSYVQKSSQETKSLIATYEQGLFKSNIKRVGVLGKYNKSEIFDKSFVENMILATSLTLDITYEESFNLLLKMGIVNTDYVLIYDKNNIILLYEGKSLSFFVRDENVIFNIENE